MDHANIWSYLENWTVELLTDCFCSAADIDREHELLTQYLVLGTNC